MITIFNRTELTITMDVKRQSDIRAILTANGIDYVVKATNLQSAAFMGSNRGRYGNFGINQDQSYEYRFYVRKKDYDEALMRIRSV